MGVPAMLVAARALAEEEDPFAEFASPVSNPVNFEDPRPTTEVRPIYAYHRISDDFVTRGGEAHVAAAQEWRRAEPKDDLLSTLVHAEVDGERLGDEELLGVLRLLLPAGAETTYRLLGSALFALLTHPDQLEEVRAERAKLDLVIEETLRWESPVQYASRETTAPVKLGGVKLPAGAMVAAALGSANRDERRYEEPDRFDMHRASDDHLAFGFGKHFCAGAHLARLEARIALGALLDRLPNLRLDPAGEASVVGLAFRSPDRLPVVFDAGAGGPPHGVREE